MFLADITIAFFAYQFLEVNSQEKPAIIKDVLNHMTPIGNYTPTSYVANKLVDLGSGSYNTVLNAINLNSATSRKG